MKRILGLLPLTFVLFLSGCSTKTPITSHNTGIWDHYLVYPISFVITHISHLFNDNYGIGIIAITLLIRLALSPLVISLNDNQWRMQQLQPEMKKLREQYNAKDPKTQQLLNQETMKLYQKHGINPAMGCLPAVIQMFILMALYNAIVRTKEIAAHTFLWFSLGQTDSLHILPVLAAVATFLQYWVMNSRAKQSDNAMLNQQMKMMLYVMPVMIFFMSFHLVSAIGLYWVVGNTFMAFQTLYLERRKQKKTLALQMNQEG
ncbi:membrane protein insertase YidC [Ectobacillus panaciterrae]|uniref:membrane protein insertase YidC n=1 Tax=Ectobacillus panaciterrae TaxID=363872 RepID=UPI0003FBF66D|nr:membrane protein insertase YidC [Ectobacillus panaciterrae]